MKPHCYAISQCFEPYYQKPNCWVSWESEGVKLTFEPTRCGLIKLFSHKCHYDPDGQQWELLVCRSSIGPNVVPLQWAKLYIFWLGNSCIYFLGVQTENVDLSFMVSVGNCSVGSMLEGVWAVVLLLKSDFKWIGKDKKKKKRQKCKTMLPPEKKRKKKKKKLKPLELCKNNRKFILN